MPISDRELEHIRRKQREFLDELLVRKWTTPRRSLGKQDALDAGRRIGLRPILVCEFLHFWVASGELDESWRTIAEEIQASLGPDAFSQIEADFADKMYASSEIADERAHAPLVFLCHASEDKPHVREYARQLQEAGFATWLDEDQLLPGQQWELEIPKAIARASAVVIFISSRSQKRGYLQKEIARVLDESEYQPEDTIFLIPAKLEACEVPSRLTKWHWVDLTQPQGFKKLCVALDTHRNIKR